MTEPTRIEMESEALLEAERVRTWADPQIAERHAYAVMADQPAYYRVPTVPVLRCYLLAAGLSGAPADALTAWIKKPNDETALRVLRDNAALVPAGWASRLAKYHADYAGLASETPAVIRQSMLVGLASRS
ncbi:hypothetical protein [Kitasatospora kifunensis]|uniref:Uncharacterized protein n=1 Tax=Kitasatospora kifunensis TaxID=58351 RepID=A0A7W7RBZ9_KITKI|nr:hypothetical protein [Kitasatospora kifunensis]MBB4929060.1 hypothetical protein [Kitasatospora kifunensis]